MNPLLHMRLGREGSPVRLWQLVRPEVDGVSTIENGDLIEWLGEYPDLRTPHLNILTAVALALSIQYPVRHDHRISICEASSRTGECPNHPTHSGTTQCVILDVHYFTLGWESNHTQNGGSPAPLYQPDGSVGEHFDAERNTMFIRLLKEIFPAMRTLAGTAAKNAMMAQARLFWPADLSVPAMFRKDEARVIDRAIQADDNPILFHNTHMHIYFGASINWEATL